MRKKSKLWLLLSLLVFFTLPVILTSCSNEEDSEVENVWTFYNLATRGNYVDISIYNSGTPSSFRLYPNEMQDVTWVGWDGFRGGYKITASYNASYTYYDTYKEQSGRMIVIYDTVIK